MYILYVAFPLFACTFWARRSKTRELAIQLRCLAIFIATDTDWAGSALKAAPSCFLTSKRCQRALGVQESLPLQIDLPGLAQHSYFSKYVTCIQDVVGSSKEPRQWVCALLCR